MRSGDGGWSESPQQAEHTEQRSKQQGRKMQNAELSVALLFSETAEMVRKS